MMRKKFLATLTAVIMTLVTVIVTGSNVYAEGTQKNATLTDIKANFDGRDVTLQAYNIDGYNYVMARAVANELDMAVSPKESGKQIPVPKGEPITPDMHYLDGQLVKQGPKVIVGVYIDSFATAEKITVDKLTDKNITVTMQKGSIEFSEPTGMIDTEFFNANGRSFFKLADMGKSSEQFKNSIRTQLSSDMWTREQLVDSKNNDIKSFTVNWNDATKTVEIKTIVTDSLKVWDDAHPNG